MAKPTSILEQVKGMTRDFSIDQLPKGYVWDLQDYIPHVRGGMVESRGPWTYMTAASLAGRITGGSNAVFTKGEKLLVVAGGNIYDHPRIAPGAAPVTPTNIGAFFTQGVSHNGKMLEDKLYFTSPSGSDAVKYIVWTGTNPTIGGTAGGPPTIGVGLRAKLCDVYKGRLLATDSNNAGIYLYFSPLTIDGGPDQDYSGWDPASYIGTARPITALGVLPNMILVFHDGITERIKGGIPPGTNIDTDMELDTFSSQYGCVDPTSVVPWQENLLFANSHGVMMTDGSSIRSLTDQGGIGELWRLLYGLKRSGTQVSCCVFLNCLFCSINTTWTGSTPQDQRSTTLVCDLSTRSWFRFQNVDATAFIPSETGVEQVWWGTDTQNIGASFANRLAHLSPTLAGLSDLDVDNPGAGSFADATDANGLSILPDITTGFAKIGKEGQRRIRNVYVSHATQKQGSDVEALQVKYRLTPVTSDNWTTLGTLPTSDRYDRKRLPIGRDGYGIQVNVSQVLPSRLTRLYDISVDGWMQDRGKVS